MQLERIIEDDRSSDLQISKFKHQIKATINNVNRKYKAPSNYKNVLGQMIEHSTRKFIKVYYKVSSEISTEKEDNVLREIKDCPDNVKMIYSGYVAASLVSRNLDTLVNGQQGSTLHLHKANVPNIDIDLSSNSKLIDSSLESIIKFFVEKDDISPGSLKEYFEHLSEKYEDMLTGLASVKTLQRLEEISWSYGKSKVEGVNCIKNDITKGTKKEASLRDTNNEKIKQLSEYHLTSIRKKEIVGNKEGIDAVETEICSLMHYDSDRKENPADEFRQYLLFTGKPGTGKTMLANYGMTLANAIGKRYDKEASLVELDFEDRYQYGPVENLRSQLREISFNNQIYVLFIDEIDTKIPNRKDGLKDHQKQVAGEFLRFRGEAGYVNNRNFMIFATSNSPNDIDPAVLSKFEILNIPGPTSGKERTKILYNLMRKGINEGYVKIRDWDKIENVLDQYELNGRDLKNISTRANSNYRKIFRNIRHDLDFEEVKGKVRDILKKDHGTYTTYDKDLINSIKYQAEKVILGKSNHIL